MSSTKVLKGTKVSIAEPPIVTSLKVQHSTLATPTRNPSLVKSGLSQKITSSSLTIPDPLRRTTLDNVAQVPHYPQNLKFPVRPAQTPAIKIPAVGDDTPSEVRQVGTQGRQASRILPGRGRLSTADSSNQSATNVTEQGTILTGNTLTNPQRQSTGTVADSGVETITNSNSSLYSITFDGNQTDYSLLETGDNVSSESDLSRIAQNPYTPVFNRVNVSQSPGFSPNQSNIYNLSSQHPTLTQVPQYAATQGMHKLYMQKQCKKDNLEKMYESVKNHMRQNPLYLLKWQEYFAPEVEAVIEKKFKKHFESINQVYARSEWKTVTAKWTPKFFFETLIPLVREKNPAITTTHDFMVEARKIVFEFSDDGSAEERFRIDVERVLNECQVLSNLTQETRSTFSAPCTKTG